MSLIHLIEEEGAYGTSSFEINFTLDPLKAIRKTEEHFEAHFPLNSRAKKVILKIKLTKQKYSIRKKLYTKLATVLLKNSYKYFVLLLFTSS